MTGTVFAARGQMLNLSTNREGGSLFADGGDRSEDDDVERISAYEALKVPKKEPRESDYSPSSARSLPTVSKKKKRKRATQSVGESSDINFASLQFEREMRQISNAFEYLDEEDVGEHQYAARPKDTDAADCSTSRIMHESPYEASLNIFDELLNSSGSRSSSVCSMDNGMNEYLGRWRPEESGTIEDDVNLELSEDEFDDTEKSCGDDENVRKPKKRKYDEITQQANVKQEIKEWIATGLTTYSRMICTSRVPCPDVMSFDEAVFTKKLDSVENGKSALEWLIAPYSFEMFFQRIYQQKVFTSSRQNDQYYENFLSLKMVTNIFKKYEINYGTDANMLVNQIDGNENPFVSGRAYLADVRSRLQERCVLELHHLPAFSSNVWHVCEILQEVFCSPVSASAYLTPSDVVDISFVPENDRFILQLEGPMKWKVRDVFCEGDTEGQADTSHLIFDGLLNPGDLLYVPKRFSCRGFSQLDRHALFVCIDVNSGNFPYDCFEKIFDSAVSRFQDKSFSSHISLVPSVELAKNWCSESNFEDVVKKRFLSFFNEESKYMKDVFDKGCKMCVQDMFCDYLSSALPPKLSKAECRKSAIGGPDFDFFSDTCVSFTPDVRIKFLRRHGQRLVAKENNEYFVVHRMANTRYPPSSPTEISFKLDTELLAGFDQLVDQYPRWCKVRDLKCTTMEEKKNLAQLLYFNGLVMAKTPEVPE